MRPHVVIGAASVFAAIAASVLLAQTPAPAPVQTPQTSPPVFRTSTDLVTVDVGVKNGGTPVAALTASDFVLLDNGVPQHIESVEMEQVPVDITILVDTNNTVAASVDDFNSELQKIKAFVRPDDQLRVMQIDTYVTDLLPIRRAALQPPIGRLKPGGLSSAHDGLAAAMMRANPDRPNLIVAITDSIDAISTLTSEAVRDIARQSSATMHISWVTMSMWDSPPAPVGVTNWPLVYWESAHEREVPFNCGTTGACQPNHRSWVPYYELFGPRRELHDIGNLREATALTGGAIHAPGIFAERNAAAVFQKVFEDYRRSYLLRYTPQGVSHEGWHEISVQIPAHAGYEIHSRRGYAIDTSTPATVPHADTAPGSNPAATIADLTSAYGRADYAVALTTMRQFGDRAKLIRDFRAAGNPWPATPRREALFVMELAEAALAAHRADATDAARGLLTTYSKLVRQPLEPDAFEHDWLLAELAILEGTIQPALAQSFAANALARFPDEPRVLLAQAILADQRWPLGTFDGLGASTTAVVNDVTARYDAAIAHDGTAFEARVRKAWLLHRLRNDPAALTLLDAATAATATSAPAPDAVLRYLQQLIRGHVLDALGRLDAAIDAYRAALVIQPGTQSARVALMNALVKKGDRDEARTLAEAIQTAPAGTPDPWWLYWQGDYRLYPGLIAQLRQKAFVP